MTSSSDLLKKWQQPRHARDLPPWPHFASGHLVEGHAAWRSKRPVLRAAACVGCLQCYLMCPDAVIRVHEGRLIWELLLCKGCGLCAQECRHGAIEMEQEAL